MDRFGGPAPIDQVAQRRRLPVYRRLTTVSLDRGRRSVRRLGGGRILVAFRVDLETVLNFRSALVLNDVAADSRIELTAPAIGECRSSESGS